MVDVRNSDWVVTYGLRGAGERVVEAVQACADEADRVRPHRAVFVQPHLGRHLPTACQRKRPATCRDVSKATFTLLLIY